MDGALTGIGVGLGPGWVRYPDWNWTWPWTWTGTRPWLDLDMDGYEFSVFRVSVFRAPFLINYAFHVSLIKHKSVHGLLVYYS